MCVCVKSAANRYQVPLYNNNSSVLAARMHLYYLYYSRCFPASPLRRLQYIYSENSFGLEKYVSVIKSFQQYTLYVLLHIAYIK
jgi:hypothetical protein